MPVHPLTLLPLALAAAPAAAQAIDQDVRCVLVGNAFVRGEKDPAKQRLALATSLFFAGRADARLSPAQMRAAVVAQGRLITAGQAGELMTACARAFQAKAQALDAMGKAIAAAQPRPAPPAAMPSKK